MAIKYHCESVEADRVLNEVKAECMTGMDDLTAVGLSLMKTFSKEGNVARVAVGEEFLFRS